MSIINERNNMTKPEAIYIATRLSDDNPLVYLNNLDESILAAIAVWKKGHYPYVPGHDYIYLMRMRDVQIERVYSSSLEWLRRCDSILIVNGLIDSTGVQREHALAKELGIHIYLSITEIPEVQP